MTKKKPHLVLVDGSLVAQRDVPLTAKQAGFVRSLMSRDENGKPMSLSDASRANYNTGNMTDQTVWTTASLLASQDKVRSRRQALETQKDENALLCAHSRLEFIISRLEVEALGKGADSNSASRVRALELIGKLADQGGSLFQDRLVTEDARDAETIRTELQERLARLLSDTTGTG